MATKTTFRIDEQNETAFYNAVNEAYGRKRGGVAKAMNAAMREWLENHYPHLLNGGKHGRTGRTTAK